MGQAVLCTIHQPSAILFQEFDQLLFLARGGKTVYYGPIGENSRTLLDYFERNGARKCEEEENPAEYMLDVVNLGTNTSGQNWFDVWKQSKEFTGVQEEIDRIHQERSTAVAQNADDGEQPSEISEFAMPFWFQLYQVTYRVFQQYWRMPDYIIAKWGLGTLSGLFIGFSFFHAKTSLQGMETVLYSLFMLCTIFSSVVQQVNSSPSTLFLHMHRYLHYSYLSQIMPLFVTQRSLYEVRERPSKAYSWKAFLIANIIVEVPYQIIMALLVFACYYYPTVGVQTSAQQGLVLLLCIEFFVYGGTFAQMIIAALPDTETASAVVLLLFAMSLTFCGIMQSPSALPGFWIFMYRVSPFTYWVGGMAAAQLHNREVVCSSSETSIFNPPTGQTCQQYMTSYLELAGGQLQNPNATSDCRYCSLSVADEYLAASDIYFDQRWRNFGLLWVYIFFNIFIAAVTYYLFRIRKWNLEGFKERFRKTKKQ
jgi:ATP-binding cassette, subfamily G (WHITE), member 2, PDR